MSEERENCCSKCKWWNPTTGDREAQVGSGDCCIRSPTVLATVDSTPDTSQRGDPLMRTYSGSMTRFPSMYARDWCGEFEALPPRGRYDNPL